VTRTELLVWLQARQPEVPPTLEAHLRQLLTDGPGSVPEDLAEHGRATLARVLARPGGGRELALDLLAADALVTYAFEAQAELDSWGLVELARRIAGDDA
jgi:hypothetical protein